MIQNIAEANFSKITQEGSRNSRNFWRLKKIRLIIAIIIL